MLELMEETEALQERVLSQLEAMKKRAYWRRSKRLGMRKDWYLAKKAALKGSRFRRYIPSVEVVLSGKSELLFTIRSYKGACAETHQKADRWRRDMKVWR